MKTDYTSDERHRVDPDDPDDLVLRPAVSADGDTIASIWFHGWGDGHIGNVPAALHRHRRLADFQRRVPSRLGETTVATVGAGSEVVGFVMVSDNEIEQIYVDQAARGTDVAAMLLRHGEQLIFSRFDLAWLAVASGNGRARRFYERNGWTDGGAFDYAASIDGGTITVPVRRYEKAAPRR